MGITCKYYGDVAEGISVNIEDHLVVLCEAPTPPLENGCTYGGVQNAYLFLSADEAKELGTQLIAASGQKEENDRVKHRY